MPTLPRIYGFDLVTDAEGPIIDPAHDRIIAIGISTDSGDEIYEGDEAEILLLVDRRLEMLREGVLTTWHGSVHALPLIAQRAAACGVDIDLRLATEARRSAGGPVAGVERPMWGSWHHHAHLDLARVYEEDTRRWNPLRSRRSTDESFIPMTDELAKRDPRKDARLARNLAERRWAQARKVIDRVPPGARRAADYLGHDADSMTN